MMGEIDAVELPELSEANFKCLSPTAGHVFALRAAMRVMPLIGGGGKGLAFWPDDQRRHLAAAVAAIDSVLLFLNGRTAAYPLPLVATAAAAAAAAAVDASVDAAAAAAAAAAATVAARATATKAATAAAFTTNIEMQWDLQQLMQASEEIERSSKSFRAAINLPTELIVYPLWQQPDGRCDLPEVWASIVARWRLSMAELGMDDVVQRYMSLVDGKPWDIDETERRFNAWYEEYGKEIELDKNTLDENIKRDGSVTRDGAFNRDGSQNHNGNPTDDNPQKNPQPTNTIKTASIANPTGDHATTKDALGREALVKALAAFLDHKEYKGQNTIGLLGHWGAGKSSVLNMLEDALSENPKNGFNKPKTKYLTATFNAWAYEHTDNIQAGLAQEVVNGLTKDLGFFQRLKLAREFAKATQPFRYGLSVWGLLVVWLGALWAGMSEANLLTWYQAAGGGVLAFVVVAWQQTKTVFAHPMAGKLQTYLRLPSFGKHIGQLPVIQQQVKALCKLVLTPNGKGDGNMIMTNDKRLLLMIDDLDRCGEDGIVKTLEAVKLVMDLPNVTTIIAVDHRMALAALAVHYHNLAEKGSERTAHAIARDYLGKILTLPIQLDTPGDAEIGEYLDKVLFMNLEKDSPAVFKPAISSDESNIGEPATEAINSQSEEVGNIGSNESADNVEGQVFNVEPDSKQDFDEKVAPKTERESVDEVVKDSKEERDQFAALSKALKITNPRQLKRLHNSYRLLKALDFHQVGGDNGVYGAVRERLLAMIFWMEWVSCLDKKARDKEEGFMRMPAYKESSLDGLNFSKSTYDMIKGMLFPHYALDESSDSYDGLKERVKVFMLPFADISNEPVNEYDKK